MVVTIQKEVEDQMDAVEAYAMINGMCKDEGVKQLNLSGVNVETPAPCPWKRKGGIRYAKLQQITA